MTDFEKINLLVEKLDTNFSALCKGTLTLQMGILHTLKTGGRFEQEKQNR
ncbi:hypothetical protein QQ054_10690 [Oscillatoria amoena NRMC-F 0135]|nr:hypothetical protein [Oscillatoria amoena NRMC-F 0135]